MYRRAKYLAMFNLLVVLILTLTATGVTFAQGPVAGFTATHLEPDSTFTAVKVPASQGAAQVPVIVKLQESSLASYRGGIPGLAATSPEVTGEKRLNAQSARSRAYLNHLERSQGAVRAAVAAAIPAAHVTQAFGVVMNALAVTVPADKVAELAAIPGVVAVYPDEILQLETDNSPQFIGAPAVWNALGGQGSAGEGVIVGVLDTGIWPEHPSFADPDPAGKPYAAPPPAPSGNLRACQFSGGANPGAPFSCNNKLIGAQRFMNTYQALIGLLPDEYTTARDDDGHGTHTSSTAAGNGGVAASIFGVPRGTISGIAPRAHVMAYKVCGDQGCFSSDSAAAVQQAILDGVDAINFSISGGTNPYSDAVELAFLDAYAAGVFVAASAGNSGPGLETTSHRGPWVTTVAASTQDRAFANDAFVTADGGATLNLHGASLTPGVGPAPVFVSPTDPGCNAPFAAGSVAGKIVVCRRGVTGRAEKGYNVLQGGAAGMILYNNAANVTDLETDNHWLPAIHVQFADGQALLAFITANTNVQATLTAGVKEAATGDVMASFSSRGGPGQSIGVSKPDITAPGVQILAGHSAQHLAPPAGVALGPQGELFQAIAGTSMSSPHIAGAGALLAAMHPDWTPGQIKSALMTTASTQVVKEDGSTPANAFDFGSGRVDLAKAGDPGLTIDASAGDYVTHRADLWNANYPSIYIPTMPGLITLQRTVHSLELSNTAWLTSVVGATDFSVTLPNNLDVPAGGSAAFAITIDARNLPIGAVRMATLLLSERSSQGARTLHIPITFVRTQAPVTLAKTCAPGVLPKGATTDCTISFANTTFDDATVNVVDVLPKQLKLVAGSVANGTASADLKVVSFNGTLAGAQPPDISIAAGSSPAGGYLPLAAFGIPPVSGVTDDSLTNFTVPAFTYAGETYTRIGFGSNGYAVVGGGTGADIAFMNQTLPDPTRPNNVIAPYWTDLNPPAGGALRIGTLTDGSDTWLVLDWQAVREFSQPRLNSFQIWIGVNGDANPAEDVSIAYGPIQGNGDGGFLTSGAENRFGNRGANYYVNGIGTLPANGTQLRVTSSAPVPGESHDITFTALGNQYGKWVNYAQMTSNLSEGTSVASFAGEVTK